MPSPTRGRDENEKGKGKRQKGTQKKEPKQNVLIDSKKAKGEPEASHESDKTSNENLGKAPHPDTTKGSKKESTESSEGGSVIIDRVHEPLQAALDAYSSCITPLTEIPKKLQEYPNPQEEKVRLVVHQQLIQETQTMLEGPLLRCEKEKHP